MYFQKENTKTIIKVSWPEAQSIRRWVIWVIVTRAFGLVVINSLKAKTHRGLSKLSSEIVKEINICLYVFNDVHSRVQNAMHWHCHLTSVASKTTCSIEFPAWFYQWQWGVLMCVVPLLPRNRECKTRQPRQSIGVTAFKFEILYTYTFSTLILCTMQLLLYIIERHIICNIFSGLLLTELQFSIVCSIKVLSSNCAI